VGGVQLSDAEPVVPEVAVETTIANAGNAALALPSLTAMTMLLLVPVTVGVPTELIRGDVYYWGSLMAAALMVGLPVAILYNFFLDRFIQGITGGVGK